MSNEQKPEQTPREKIAKLAAMSPEDFSAFMRWNFSRICSLPLPEEFRQPPSSLSGDETNG